MTRKFTLSFATAQCDRCGGVRILTQACADCGRLPRAHETQPELERRRKVLRAYRAASPIEVSAFPTEFDAARVEILALHSDVIKAFAAVARGSDSPRGLIEAFGAFDARVAYWAKRQRRPHTNRGRSLGKALALWREGLGVFATALEAPTILAAQDCEARGQRLIDAAVEVTDSLCEITESEALLASPEGFGGIGSSARALAGGNAEIAALDARLQQIAGREGDPSAIGLGLQHHMFRQIMLSTLDLEECLAVARVAEARMDGLASIASDPKWQARTGVVTAQFSSSAFNLSRIDEATDLETAATALQLVMQCRDGIIRHCLATVLAADSDEFHALHRKKTGYVLNRAATLHPDLLLNENLSQVLRHAGAHFDYDYDIDGNDFVTQADSDGESRLAADEFLDEVLGYVQTSVSLLLALTSAITIQGIELEISRHTPERDLLGQMAILAGFLGFEDVTVIREGETLAITARGDAQKLATAVGGMAAIAPETFKRITGRISDDGSTQTWEAPFSAFRAYLGRPTDQSEVDEHLALARLLSNVRIDSQPVLDEKSWIGLGVSVVEGTADLPLRDRVLRVREVQLLAEADGQFDVAGHLAACLKELREGGSVVGVLPSPFVRPARIG